MEKIKIQLKTASPLSIGTGEQETVKEEKANGEKISVLLDKIALDFKGKPYIPATAIKGAFRNTATQIYEEGEEEGLKNLFGFQGETNDKDHAEGAGGKLIFENAYIVESDRKDIVGKFKQTSINRVTGAAKSHHLFASQYIKEGVEFIFDIVLDGTLDEDENELFSKLINYIKTNKITLGSQTTNGWGQCSFEVYENKITSNDDSIEVSSNELAIKIKLNFQTPFLVAGEYKSENDIKYLAPLKDSEGKAYLPASSFRGAFRSQMEKIFNTIKTDDTENIPDSIFGNTNAKSLIRFTDFNQTKEATDTKQEQDFVAIDRFTGGAKEGAKFKIESSQSPTLSGKIFVNIDKLTENKNIKKYLAFTLRDLIEGDISFGYASSKGYGFCTAEVDISNDKNKLEDLRKFLTKAQEKTHQCDKTKVNQA